MVNICNMATDFNTLESCKISVKSTIEFTVFDTHFPQTTNGRIQILVKIISFMAFIKIDHRNVNKL